MSDGSDSETNFNDKDKDSSNLGSNEELPIEEEDEQVSKVDKRLGKDFIKMSEWQRGRKIHQVVSQVFQETQREEVVDLLMPWEIIPLYQQPLKRRLKTL